MLLHYRPNDIAIQQYIHSLLSSCWWWWWWWWSCCWRFSQRWWGCLQRCNFIARRKNATKSIRTTLICHLTRYLDNFDICIQSAERGRGGEGQSRRNVNGSQQQQWQLKAGPSIKQQRNQTGMQLTVGKKKQRRNPKQMKVGKGNKITKLWGWGFLGLM